MTVVTSNGQTGSGGQDVAVRVARLLEVDYVDRLILAEAARRVGATIEAVEQKELRKLGLRDRIARFIQIMLERSAMSGAGGEPYFGPGVEALLARQYAEVSDEPITAEQQLDDKRFIEVTTAVINELADEGNVVIVGRGSNVILKSRPDVFHVGFVAPLELRISNIMEREQLIWKDAGRFTVDNEKAREGYFKKFFKVNPNDPSLYHMMVNLGYTDTKTAAEMVAHAAKHASSLKTSPGGGA